MLLPPPRQPDAIAATPHAIDMIAFDTAFIFATPAFAFHYFHWLAFSIADALISYATPLRQILH
jgi:hypothetical protein